MLIKIYANDGKEFKGGNYNILVNQLNAYESEQRKKKEKEEAERKTREEKEKKILEQIKLNVETLNATMKQYKKDFGNNLKLYTNNENGVYACKYTSLGAYPLDEVLTIVRNL